MDRPSTTWDGKPVSNEKPYGASVVVFRPSNDGFDLLMLHRAQLGIDFEGPWAWTPPSGARQPDEPIDSCARRELLEEAGLTLPLHLTTFGTEEWYVYLAEAPHNAAVSLDSEHDRFEWLAPQVAMARCQPEIPHELLRAVVEHLNA